ESIASGYTSMAHAQQTLEAQTSVLASAIDTVETQGQAVVDLISVSSASGQQQVFTDPMLGQHVNVLA
ncbi:MAG: putative motility protein, partial [Spirochaetota bacterium]